MGGPCATTIVRAGGIAVGIYHPGWVRTDMGGPRVITTKQTFSAALDETQERGWAAAIEEAEPGVAAIAVAIRVGEQVVEQGDRLHSEFRVWFEHLFSFQDKENEP